MKLFLKSLLIFAAPFVIYLIIIVLIDPFNYLNFSKVIDDTQKEIISQGVEQHLYRMIQFDNDPRKNISLGDSRANSLADFLDQDRWANLSFGGASLKEAVQTFWWAAENAELDTVIIAVNFNNYNKYNKRFWVEETLKIKKNFFSYAFTKFTFRASFLLLKSSLMKKEVTLNKVTQSREEFWQTQITAVAKKFFEQYAYPDNYYNDLSKISKYCTDNGIKLIFWIPPSHDDFNATIEKFDLLEEECIFEKDMISLGEVYDYNYPNEITSNKDLFSDPLHVKDSIIISIRDEILIDKPFLARHSIL